MSDMTNTTSAQRELEPMENCTKVLHFKRYLPIRHSDGQIKRQLIRLHGVWYPKEGAQVCKKTKAFGYLPCGRLHYAGGYYVVV
jgi:hypothetical protein